MTQTKKGSMLETVTNTFSGTVVSYVLTLTVMPLFDMHPSYSDAFGLSIIYTIASLIRGYVIRRVFNKSKNVIIK